MTQSPMQVLRSVAMLRAQVADFRRGQETIALVPTMGALHAGHLALVATARKKARRCIATIFVNPAQFAPNEDFERYPRDEAGDLAALAGAGCDVVFAPPVEFMYPPGFATQVIVSGVSEGLCGPFRPGHFAGVATVVTKLLLQAMPDVAIFGQKDFQQLQVIRRVVRDLDIPVEIFGNPTVREPDGLAISSRNLYLSPEQRRIAAQMPQCLQKIAQAIARGEAPEPLLEEGKRQLAQVGFDPVQYLECADAETLSPSRDASRPRRVFIAAYLGRVRLIDNMPVE